MPSAIPLALRTEFDGEGDVTVVYADGENEFDCSLYADESGDSGNVIDMIEAAFTCDCGNDVFCRNACTGCGASAPWAAKLGCGLA